MWQEMERLKLERQCRRALGSPSRRSVLAGLLNLTCVNLLGAVSLGNRQDPVSQGTELGRPRIFMIFTQEFGEKVTE